MQFDNIAIPRLGFLVLLVMAKGRERGAKTVSAMFALGIDTECAQTGIECLAGERLVVGAREHIAPIAGDFLHALKNGDGLSRQRHDMVPAGLHFDSGNGPALLDIQINLTPLHAMDHAGAGDSHRIKPKRVPDDVTEGDVLPSVIATPENG